MEITDNITTIRVCQGCLVLFEKDKLIPFQIGFRALENQYLKMKKENISLKRRITILESNY